MEIKREWYTIDDLSHYWSMAVADIEHLLETRQLKAEYKILPGKLFTSHDYSNEQLMRYVGYAIDPCFRPDNLPIGEIRIPRAEIERYEAETVGPNPTLASQSPDQPYLDPQHKHYSKELALAVTAWLALYGNNGKFKPFKSHIKQIKATLAGNDLSPNMIEKIATVVNPNKKGGAPATDY